MNQNFKEVYKSKLEKILLIYERLQKEEPSISSEEATTPQKELDQEILSLLLFRDTLQKTYCSTKLKSEDLIDLMNLDHRFQTQAVHQSWATRIDKIRRSYNPTVEQVYWWWFSEGFQAKGQKKTNFSKRLNWLLRLLIDAIWLINLALLINVSSKVISGTPDLVGTWAVILNSILGLLVAQGILFGASSWVERAASDLAIKKQFHKAIQLSLATVILCVALTLNGDLPIISNIYYNKAESLYRPKEYPFTHLYIPQGPRYYVYEKLINIQTSNDAGADYYRAIQFNTQNWNAHNRLGEIFEDQRDVEQSVTHYQIASEGNLAEAFINLSRYYILHPELDENHYMTAIGLLNRADEIHDQARRDQRKKQDCSLENNFFEIEQCRVNQLNDYNQRVHYAWAYLKLARLSDDQKVKVKYLNDAMLRLENIENYEVLKNVENGEFVEHDKFAHPRIAYCVRAEIYDEYPQGSLPDQYKVAPFSSDYNLPKCYRAISNIEGVLRSYEAAWWTSL